MTLKLHVSRYFFLPLTQTYHSIKTNTQVSDLDFEVEFIA